MKLSNQWRWMWMNKVNCRAVKESMRFQHSSSTVRANCWKNSWGQTRMDLRSWSRSICTVIEIHLPSSFGVLFLQILPLTQIFLCIFTNHNRKTRITLIHLHDLKSFHPVWGFFNFSFYITFKNLFTLSKFQVAVGIFQTF